MNVKVAKLYLKFNAESQVFSARLHVPLVRHLHTSHRQLHGVHLDGLVHVHNTLEGSSPQGLYVVDLMISLIEERIRRPLFSIEYIKTRAVSKWSVYS
jgi:hypothetical protein